MIELYRQGIVPQATAALDSALSAYEVGTVDFLTLVESALTILNYELRYHEEIRDYYRNLASLEEVLGLVLGYQADNQHYDLHLASCSRFAQRCGHFTDRLGHISCDWRRFWPSNRARLGESKGGTQPF